MQIQFFLQTLLMPFFISALAYKFLPNRYAVFGVLAAWLCSFFWIQGQIPFMPQTPVEQLWVFLSVTIIAGAYISQRLHSYFLIIIYLITLLLASWPVLKYEVNLPFILELSVFIIAGSFITYRKSKNTCGAFTFAMGYSFLGLIIALTGSLLIAQISISLAAALGIYALLEIKSRFNKAQFKDKEMPVFALMFLLVLFIARVYAELDVYIMSLLIAASLMAYFSSKYISLCVAIGIYLIAMMLMFINDSGSSYY